MNPFEMLKEDHKKVKEMFKEFESAGDRALKKKADIVEKVIEALEVHTEVEESLFYPTSKESLDTEGKKLIAEAFEEHGVVKKLIAEIKDLEPGDERFEAKLTVLMESVRHHIKEEESELFPKAKKALGDEAEPLGDEMEEKKEELEGEQAPRPTRPRLEAERRY